MDAGIPPLECVARMIHAALMMVLMTDLLVGIVIRPMGKTNMAAGHGSSRLVRIAWRSILSQLSRKELFG